MENVLHPCAQRTLARLRLTTKNRPQLPPVSQKTICAWIWQLSRGDKKHWGVQCRRHNTVLGRFFFCQFAFALSAALRCYFPFWCLWWRLFVHDRPACHYEPRKCKWLDVKPTTQFKMSHYPKLNSRWLPVSLSLYSSEIIIIKKHLPNI